MTPDLLAQLIGDPAVPEGPQHAGWLAVGEPAREVIERWRAGDPTRPGSFQFTRHLKVLMSVGLLPTRNTMWRFGPVWKKRVNTDFL